MNPVSPPPHTKNACVIVFAKNQPQYIPPPASVDNEGTVVTEWELTDDEQEMIFQGGHLRVILMYALSVKECPNCKITNVNPLSPLKIEVLEPECGFMKGGFPISGLENE